MARRSGIVSTPMTLVAPMRRAPATAQRPIGPSAKTATMSPILTLPLSAPAKPYGPQSLRLDLAQGFAGGT